MELKTSQTVFSEPVHIVYLTTNLVNGKFYIGYHKTCNLNDSYLGSGKHLLNSVAKHGRENFKKETLFIFDSKEEAYAKEIEIIALHRKLNPLCMNMHVGGSGGNLSPEMYERLSLLFTGKTLAKTCGMLGKMHSEETRKAISLAKLGKSLSKESRKNISEGHRGLKHSEETKLKMRGRIVTESTRAKLRIPKSDETKKRQSEALTGRIHSEETKKKISEALIGRSLSEEHRKAISESQTGKTLSAETRKAISDSHIGRIYSTPTEETRKKISEASKGRIQSAETRKAIGEANRKRWQERKARKDSAV
jgi:hypothetical protein